MSKRQRKRVWSYFCETCCGWRPHTIDREMDHDGNISRVKVCHVCESKGPLPGIHCRKCGESSFRSLFIRHPRFKLSIRTLQCRYCRTRKRVAVRDLD